MYRVLKYTRNAEAFLEKTAIAYSQNLAFFLEFGWYAIPVFSNNASTLRVFPLRICVPEITPRTDTAPATSLCGLAMCRAKN